VRPDGARLASELANALSVAGLHPRAVVVNRGLPSGFAGHEAQLQAIAGGDPSAAPVIRYALAYSAIEARVTEDVRSLAPKLVVLPDARGLDSDSRLSALAQIGGLLRAGLE
jgi:hypothetical protein